MQAITVWVARWKKKWWQMHMDVDAHTHTSDFIVGTLTDLWDRLWKQMQDWKNLECWLGRISIILTLMKWNGMISEKMFVPGKSQELSQYSKCQKKMPETGLFSMLKGTKAVSRPSEWRGGLRLVSAMKFWHEMDQKARWMGRFPWCEMEYLLKHLFSPLLEDTHYC